MDLRNPSLSVMKACISREGRHVLVLKENHVLSVFRFQTSSIETELVKPIWEVENVRSSIWHHEESLVLLSKRNGDLEWKSFRRNSPAASGRLAAEHLLKHLILKRLEFDSLKQILCLSFQRNFCILQTSAKQIAGLRWKSDQDTEIIWALEVGEFAVWTFCDKLFVNFEPHTKSLHLYSLFEGKIKRTEQLEFSDSFAISPVRQISACPDGKMFAVLTDQLFIGKKLLKLLLQDGKNVSEISMGTTNIAVFTRQPDEYLLFNLTTTQKIYSCRIDIGEIIIFAQRYDRVDKVIKSNSVRDLKEPEKVNLMVSIDVRTSLLNTALNSQHLESTANILKIAERGNEAEICEILRALDIFLTKNLVPTEKMTSKNSSKSNSRSFGLQILGLSLGFAGRAYKKFPDCATIFNLIFAWQELLPIKPQEPSIFHGDDLVHELATKWHGWDEYSIIKDALIHNCLPIAQYELCNRNDHNFQDVILIRDAVISEIRQNIINYDARSIDEAETMMKNLGCDISGSWELMCLQVENPQSRSKLVEIMQQRHLWSEELNSCLDFISLVERFVRDSLGHVPVLTMETVSGWSPEQRRLYLAEAFLQSRNEDLLERIQPEDVWQVMLNKQILSSLRKWIENQSSSSQADGSIPYSWPISTAMIDMAAECTNNDTRDSVLNLLANQGIFAQCERQNLVAFVNRLHSIGRFHQMENIIQQPLANVNIQSITAAALDYCCQQFKPELFYDLISEHDLDLIERPTWMRLAQRFQKWKLDGCDIEDFLALCRLNNALLKETDHPTEEEFWTKHPFVALFFHLINPALLPSGIVTKAIKSLPILAHACEQNLEDPSIRQLLVGQVPINVANFFKHPQKDWDLLEHPHDGVEGHGLASSLDWTFYLRQSRPFRAFFHLQSSVKLTKQDAAMYPFAIQAIGLEDPWNKAMIQSCVLLIEMLGFNSHPLRTTLAVLERIIQDLDRANVTELCCSLLTDVQAARQLSQLLETCLLKEETSNDIVDLVDSWHLAVEYTTVYGLDLPIQFLRQCASRNQWLVFLLFVQTYEYSLEKYWALLSEFESPVKFHLQLAMRLEQPTESYVINTTSPTEVFYRLLLQGAPSDGSNGTHLLASSLRNRSIELAVLTAVLEPQQIFPCLCVYLALNLQDKSPMLDNETIPTIPDTETLSSLVLAAMSCNRFDIVLEAFHIFVPNHVLTTILDWLDSFMKGQTERQQLELVRQAVGSYEASEDLILFRQSANLFRFALHVISWALCYLIQDAEQQQELLTLWAEVQPFASISMDISVPDFGLLAEIVSLCVDSGIQVNITNLMQGSGSLQLQTECQQAVEVLLEQRHFAVALKLAKMADLPADSIFVTQLSTMLDSQQCESSSLRFRTAFWNRCHQLLTAHRVRPDIASAFFRDSLPRALNHWESHLMVDHAVNWMRLVKPPRKECLAELEILWWKTRIEADLDGTRSPVSLVDLEPDSPPFCPLLMAKVSQLADALPYAWSESSYSDSFLDKVSEWIGRNLDAEDLIGALKLSSMFHRQSLDIVLILFLIDLVENKVDLSDAKDRLRQITGLKDKEIEWKDRQSVIEYVDSELLQHGHRLCQRLSIFHQVAVTLDLKYDYVVEHSMPISILKMLLETPNQSGLPLAIGGHLNLARSWITASRIPANQVVALVKDELIEAARSAHGQVGGTETNMVVSLLRGTFNRWVTLCADPTQLGLSLLEAALTLEANNEWTVAVELLIFAHSSFTLACDVENIGQILNQARSFVDKLLLDQQWILITRLTTGIQRYTEMSYVFALLKEHDQFEYLLRKGMDRLPLLRQALLDFLRPNCAENRELFRLVALHFHMHAEVASMWQEEADSLLKPVIDQAFKSILKTNKKPIGSPSPKTLDSSPAKKSSSANLLLELPLPTLPMLKAGPDVKKALTSAMHNLAHATEYFLQAGKLNHANRCALQAELVALQVNLIARSMDGHQIYCILGLNAAQVDILICETLTYPEAEIVSRAYGFNVAWGKALMRHYILNDGSEYLLKFVRRHTITSTLVEEVLSAFEMESGFTKKGETLERISKLVSMLTDVEAKYRLASRLGLRQLVSQLLSSSALPYLKDTAWGKKANQD